MFVILSTATMTVDLYFDLKTTKLCGTSGKHDAN